MKSYMTLEIGDLQNLKYTVHRIIGSGATVQSVSRSLLVVKTAIFPRWNEEVATLELFGQRVKLFVSSTKEEEIYLCRLRFLSTFDPEGYTFRYVRDNLIDVQLEATDGSSALMIVKTISISLLVPSQLRKVFGCCWISSDSILSDDNCGKTMRH